jgi:hypothetical protein
MLFASPSSTPAKNNLKSSADSAPEAIRRKKNFIKTKKNNAIDK